MYQQYSYDHELPYYPFRSHGLLKEPFLHYALIPRAPKGAWSRGAARYQRQVETKRNRSQTSVHVWSEQ